MLRLKDRNRQIPNGLRFYLPELKWSAPGPYASFTLICDHLQRVIEANRAQAMEHKWPTNRAGIEDWVDNYNATLCNQMGWRDYVIDDAAGTLPKTSPSHQAQSLQSLRAAAAAAKELVRGAKALHDWDDSGEPPVDRDIANGRAWVCSTCPLNEKGDWTKWFTVPAAELIKRRIERVQMKGISTLHDERLQFCSACSCPLKLKVHVPIKWIRGVISDEQQARMKAGNPNCWVIKELS